MPGVGWYLVWPLLGGIGVTLLLVSQPWGAPRPSLAEWLRRMDVRAREAERAEQLDPPPAVVPWPAIDRVLRPLLNDAAAFLATWQARISLGGGGPERIRAVARIYPGTTPGRWLLQKLAVGAVVGLALPLLVEVGRSAHVPVGFIGLAPSWVWVGVGIAGFFWPERVVDNRLRQRREQLRAALPSLLGALSNGASAGLSLQACMRHVAAEHAGGPLGEAVRDMLDRFDANEYRTFGKALERLADACDTPEVERVVRQLAGNTAAGAGLVGAIQELVVGLRAEDRAALVVAGHKRAIGMLFMIAVFLVPPLLAIFLFPVIVLVRSLGSS
jgi:hypothetical protein